MGLVDLLNYLGEFGEWAAGRRPVKTNDDALRFGILGAAAIAYVSPILISATKFSLDEEPFPPELSPRVKQPAGLDSPSTLPCRRHRRCSRSKRQEQGRGLCETMATSDCPR